MKTLQELTNIFSELIDSKGWTRTDSKKRQTPRNLSISLSLEAAEVLEHFQWTEEIRDKAALAAELADVQLYLLQLASVCEIDLEQAVLDKIAVNYQRTWSD